MPAGIDGSMHHQSITKVSKENVVWRRLKEEPPVSPRYTHRALPSEYRRRLRSLGPAGNEREVNYRRGANTQHGKGREREWRAHLWTSRDPSSNHDEKAGPSHQRSKRGRTQHVEIHRVTSQRVDLPQKVVDHESQMGT